MKLEIQFKDYLKLLQKYANLPFSLERVIRPFGIFASQKLSESLLIGHVLDYLAEEFKNDDLIDPIDVATAAYELGYDNAATFLDEAPWLMVQLVRSNELNI